MNINDTATQLMYTTVPIKGITFNGVQITGTGFIFSFPDEKNTNQSIPLLITNFHVLENVQSGIIEFSVQEDGLPLKDKVASVSFDNSIISNSRLGDLDLIAIPIATIINDLTNKGISVFYKSILPDIIPSSKQINELSAIEDLTFIGYPSGIIDEINKSPLIRKGITATPIWNNFNGKPEFLIDGGVYPGSSGSPVFIYNQGSYATKEGITIGSRLYFVGVIYATQVHGGNTFLNLGKAINSVTLLKELKLFVNKLLKK